MVGARKRTSLPKADFRTRFLRVLNSHYRANPVVRHILANASLSKLSADLLSHCVDDTRTRLLNIQKGARTRAKTKLADAIRCIDSLAYVYSHLDSKPHLAEY